MTKVVLLFTFAGLMLTACLGLSPNTPILIPTDVTTTSSPSNPHFPQTSFLLGNTDDLVQGQLILENGCLRVTDVSSKLGDSFLLIWDTRYSVRTGEQGIEDVLDSSTGNVLISVGDTVEIGGGVASSEIDKYLRESIPHECPGPYWLVGDRVRKIKMP
jgi:hypothetical protein